LQVTFEYADGRTFGRKTFTFQPNSYLTHLNSEVRENGNGIGHLLTWRGGFGDRAVHAAASTMRTLYFDVNDNKLVENDAKVAEQGPALVSGTYDFAGIQDTYFAAVFVPRERQTVKLQTWSDNAQVTPESGEEALAGVAVGGEAANRYSVFVGPKDLDLLTRVNPKLSQVVDFGWFAFIAKPLFLFLNWLNDNFIRNYGWSIIVATIIINMLLLPLKLSGMKSMKKMGALQPEIAKINEKYKNLSLTDPRKAQQNEEVMALYKKHGVNPLGGGCMPLLLQIPFFYAFYKVLSIAIEVRGAKWLWIGDLAQYDPLYLLPVIMVVTQFVLQKMTPTTTADPMQQRMMLLMPLMFGFLFFKASAGLVLYWLTGNLVSIAQQWFINKATPTPVAATATVNAPKQPGKRNGRSQ
jgi:YidC/Oxa1 family membrane protein insertase